MGFGKPELPAGSSIRTHKLGLGTKNIPNRSKNSNFEGTFLQVLTIYIPYWWPFFVTLDYAKLYTVYLVHSCGVF